MENFLRTYTKAELNELFKATGFPEIAKQYCIDKYNEKYTEYRSLDITEEGLNKVKEELIEYLKEACGWNSDSLREHAWKKALEDTNIDAYIHQRELGHGHEWSNLFCNKMKEYSLSENDVMTYFYTCKAFRELRKAEEFLFDRHGRVICRKKDTLSDQEYIKVVKILSRGEGEIVERFISYNIGPDLSTIYVNATYRTVEELFQAAMSFQKLYREFISKGILDREAWEYASYLTKETAHSIKSIIYKEAIKNKAPYMEAYKFTLFCEEIIRVCEDDTKMGWFESYYSRVAVAFTEKWQKLILADIIIKNQPQNWRWPTFEKEIKQSFGLESKEEI